MAEDPMAPVPVTDAMLRAWTMMADDHAGRLPLGGANWVMMVRSLIAEIYRLGRKNPSLEKMN